MVLFSLIKCHKCINVSKIRGGNHMENYDLKSNGKWAMTVYDDGRRLVSPEFWSYIMEIYNGLGQEVKRLQNELDGVLITKTNRGIKPRSLTVEQVAEARRMKENGMSLRQIGKVFDVSGETIRRYINQSTLCDSF